MYITLRNFKNKNNSILHFYEKYFTLPYIVFFIKNIEFYIVLGYFYFDLYLYLHQAHINSS